MLTSHVVELPKAVWGIKIAQLVLSVILLALSAFDVYYAPFNASDFALFAAIFSVLGLIYYFVVLHGAKKGYSWIPLLIVEGLAVIFWLTSWALLAALYADIAAVDDDDYYYYTYYVRRRAAETVQKRDSYTLDDAYAGTLLACLVLAVITFILYCVTLGYMSAGIHRHRQAGHPMWHNGPSSASHDTEKAQSVGEQEAPQQLSNPEMRNGS